MDTDKPSTAVEKLGAKYESEAEAEEDLLVDYFEKSASVVRHTFGRFEQDMARPAFNFVLTSFRKRPIRSTFITFYLALSALPIISFVGFSIFVFATSIFFALSTAIFFASSAVSFFGFWLACTLIFFLFISFNLTLATLSTYLLAQFVLRARIHGGRAALSSLYADTRAQLPFGARRGRKQVTKPLQLHPDAGASSAEGATVGMEGKGKAREEDWDEGPTPEMPLTDQYGEKVPGMPIDPPP